MTRQFLGAAMLHTIAVRPFTFILRSLFVTSLLVSSTFAAGLASADPVRFEIHEQSLASALNQFALQSDREILFSTDIVKDMESPDVQGVYEPENALVILLADTGLGYSVTDRNTFLVSALMHVSLLAVQAGAEPAVADEDMTHSAAGQGGVVANGEPGVLRGRVVEDQSGAGLYGAILFLEGTGLKTATDNRGAYRFAAVPPGNYTLVVDYLGASSESAAVVVESETGTVQDFFLLQALETITVYGNRRSSLAQALNLQRAAENSATVVASDLLGSFPAETISEALRRVSGVSFQRNDVTGEGSRINVRGFNADAINVQLNGLELEGTGVGRDVDLSGFLADNISQVTIHKSLLPSHESNGSGGLVEIETRSGLDYGERYFGVGLEQEQTLSSKFGDELQANVTGAWQFAENFGAAATLQYRDTDRTNYDVFYVGRSTPVLPAGFTSIFRVPASFDFPFDAALDDRLVSGARYVRRDRDESNLTASLNLAWDVAEHTSLRFDAQRIEREESLSTAGSNLVYSTRFTDLPVPELGGEVRRRAYIRTFSPGLSLTESQTDLTTTTLSLRGDTNLGPWELEYKLGHSKSDSDIRNDSVILGSVDQLDVALFVDPASIVVNLDDDADSTPRVVDGVTTTEGDQIPVLSLTDAGRALVNDSGTYFVRSGSAGLGRNVTESAIAELKGRYNFAHDNFRYVEIGTKYRDTERTNSDDTTASDVPALRRYTRPFSGPNTFVDSLLPGALRQQSLSVIGANSSVPLLRPGSTAAIIDAISMLTADDPATPENEARFRFRDNTIDPTLNPGRISPATITEENLAVYFQTMTVFGKFELVSGARYERVRRNSVAIRTPQIIQNLPGFQLEPRSTFIDAGLLRFADTGGTTDKLTPSLLATYRQTDNLVIRLGYFRSTVNPRIDLITGPSFLFMDLREGRETARIQEANADLRPTTTNNFDLDIAYYFQENPGLIRLALFHKRISNNFTSLTRNTLEVGNLRDRVLAELAPLAAARPDLVNLPANTVFSLTRPENGDGGEIFGAEFEVIRQFDFLPSAWPAFVDNFAMLANVTYTGGTVPILVPAIDDNGDSFNLSLDRPLLRQPKWSGTASVSYEDGGFSGRLIYTDQSRSAISYDEFNLNIIAPNVSTLDLRLSYTMGGDGKTRYVFFLEGDDLLRGSKEADVLNATSSRFGDGSASFNFPNILQFGGGRTITLGTRVIFD